MGRTYLPNNEDAESFHVNYAGADLLGLLHKQINLCWKESYDGFPCTDWTMDSEDALACADALQIIDTESFFKKHLKPVKPWLIWRITFVFRFLNRNKYNLWSGTAEELHSWINSWIDFLRTSGGYQTI